MSRSHSHRASIATSRTACAARDDGGVSIPQPSSIDRDRPDVGHGGRVLVSIPQPSSIDRDPSTRSAVAVNEVESRSHSHRASIATLAASDCCQVDHTQSRSHSHRASIATRVCRRPPCAVSRSHSHRASIATHWYIDRLARGVVSIPQPSSIDRDRSRRPSGSVAIVSIPQPSSIDRDAGVAREHRRVRSRSHSHRASIATCVAPRGGPVTELVSIPQPSSIDRDARG